MELTAKKIEQLKKQPLIETVIKRSENNKWILHQTIITDIKPISYLKKLLTDIFLRVYKGGDYSDYYQK